MNTYEKQIAFLDEIKHAIKRHQNALEQASTEYNGAVVTMKIDEIFVDNITDEIGESADILDKKVESVWESLQRQINTITDFQMKLERLMILAKNNG